MTRASLVLVSFIAVVAIYMALGGCMSHEHQAEHAALWDEIHNTQRAVNKANHRIDDIEVGRNSPAEGYGHYAGDGR